MKDKISIIISISLVIILISLTIGCISPEIQYDLEKASYTGKLIDVQLTDTMTVYTFEDMYLVFFNVPNGIMQNQYPNIDDRVAAYSRGVRLVDEDVMVTFYRGDINNQKYFDHVQQVKQ